MYERPKKFLLLIPVALAVVVVVTHAGDGGEVAGPVARRIVLRAKQLGLLEQFSTQETQIK